MQDIFFPMTSQHEDTTWSRDLLREEHLLEHSLCFIVMSACLTLCAEPALRLLSMLNISWLSFCKYKRRWSIMVGSIKTTDTMQKWQNTQNNKCDCSKWKIIPTGLIAICLLLTIYNILFNFTFSSLDSLALKFTTIVSFVSLQFKLFLFSALSLVAFWQCEFMAMVCSHRKMTKLEHPCLGGNRYFICSKWTHCCYCLSEMNISWCLLCWMTEFLCVCVSVCVLLLLFCSCGVIFLLYRKCTKKCVQSLGGAFCNPW